MNFYVEIKKWEGIHYKHCLRTLSLSGSNRNTCTPTMMVKNERTHICTPTVCFLWLKHIFLVLYCCIVRRDYFDLQVDRQQNDSIHQKCWLYTHGSLSCYFSLVGVCCCCRLLLHSYKKNAKVLHRRVWCQPISKIWDLFKWFLNSIFLLLRHPFFDSVGIKFSKAER